MSHEEQMALRHFLVIASLADRAIDCAGRNRLYNYSGAVL